MSDDHPFQWEHEVWVKHGWCPVISSAKAWCNRAAGHDGRHMTPRISPDHSITLEYWDR